MKLLNNIISRILSAYQAGKELKNNILKQGVSDGDIQLIKNIINNHPNNTVKKFIEGLTGVRKEHEQ